MYVIYPSMKQNHVTCSISMHNFFSKLPLNILSLKDNPFVFYRHKFFTRGYIEKMFPRPLSALSLKMKLFSWCVCNGFN